MIEYETIEEAVQVLDFEAKIPQGLPENYKIDEVFVIGGSVLEIRYLVGDDLITFRTSAEPGDISGDYTNHAKEEQVEINDTKVTLKGDDKGIFLAVWEQDNNSYSLNFSAATTAEAVKNIIEHIS